MEADFLTMPGEIKMKTRGEELLLVVGARPNFIKMAPLCRALEKRDDIFFKIVHTGQHYDYQMSDIFFKELNIPEPDFYLNIGSGSHARQTGHMIIKLEELCLEHAFCSIVVIGDVNSTLAGALVGAKMSIPVVHVESGLRSFNRSMPEEINRILTDHISELLFAPTQAAMNNLRREGLEARSHFSGDVMYDMVLQGLEMAEAISVILDELMLTPRNYYLVTLHRPSNVDNPEQLKTIMNGLALIKERVIISAHPRLAKMLHTFGISPAKNICITEPFGYLDFIVLEKNAKKVITDSGGVQKEAFFTQTPCVTLRTETEWVETVETGANILVKECTEEAILEAVFRDVAPFYEARPYGDGKAAEMIIEMIQQKCWNRAAIFS
jgi:UDP-GlcNAc3NAcA epimerase